MSKSHHNDGPTFRPGTMKAPRKTSPDPVRQQVALEDAARGWEHSRQFDKLRNKVGLYEALRASGLKLSSE